MTSPIRPEVFALTELPKLAAEMTLRDALEWFKGSVRKLTGASLRPLERRELDGAWVSLVNAIAEREGVPTGSLSYYLGELATAEMRLVETVIQEAQSGP